METGIEKTIRRMTSLDAAGYAILTLRSPNEEEIRKVIRGYIHAERKDPYKGGTSEHASNIREATGLGGVRVFDMFMDPKDLNPSGENTLPQYLMRRTWGMNAKRHELIYFPAIRETIGDSEIAGHRTPEQLQILQIIRQISAMKREEKNNTLMVLGCTDGVLCRDLREEMYVLDIPCPEEDELKNMLIRICAEAAGTKMTGLTEDLAGTLAAQLRGLREEDVQRIVRMAYVESEYPLEDDGKGRVILKIIQAYKQERITGVRGLTWLEPEKRKVGGMDTLVHWLEKSRNIFLYPHEAKNREAYAPKGILLAGLPGCGKTHLARRVAWILGAEKTPLPLLQMNLDGMLSKWQGESEGAFQMALQMVESAAPCVLLVDEIEKVFGGINGGTAQESMRHLFMNFLQWMQKEREKPILVIATANRTDKLPPELKRKGRFDEVFYVGIPEFEDVRSILRIHLESRRNVLDPRLWEKTGTERQGKDGKKTEQDGLDLLADVFFREAAKERRFLSGADIEVIVTAALRRMFADWKEEEIRKERGEKTSEEAAGTAGEGFPYQAETLQKALINELKETRSYFDSNLPGTAIFWLEMHRDQFRNAANRSILDPEEDKYDAETGCFGSADLTSEKSRAYSTGRGDDRKREAYRKELEEKAESASKNGDYRQTFRYVLAREILMRHGEKSLNG